MQLSALVQVFLLHAAAVYAAPVEADHPNTLQTRECLPDWGTGIGSYCGSWNGNPAILNCETHELVTICHGIGAYCYNDQGGLICEHFGG
ncbi:hypothetical protein F5Y18DRAFT_389014 [Xylariaceae sp. FL1019]|nr:hypothetical protein F5Y18DRAFT_389014 [Xylariaceae sp. FL1019]